jgi:hypothetical protein
MGCVLGFVMNLYDLGVPPEAEAYLKTQASLQGSGCFRLRCAPAFFDFGLRPSSKKS